MAAFRISAWTHPEDPGGFALKEHSISVLTWQSNDPLDPRGRCSFTVPETYDWQNLLATQDPTQPTETSLIRLYRHGVDNTGQPEQEFKLVRFKKRITEDGEAVIDLFGVDWRLEALDPAVVRWWDWTDGAAITRQPDWSFGGRDQRNLLENNDFQGGGKTEKQKYHVHASAGTYTITISGFGTTVGIPPYEAGGRAGDVEIALEALAGINDVTVTGKGHTQNDPLVVAFNDPKGNIPKMTLNEGGLTHAGCAHPPCHNGIVSTLQDGGFDPEPWTPCQYAGGSRDTSIHGTYLTSGEPIEVVDDPALGGDEQALRVNPLTGGAGAQQVIDGEDGFSANAHVEVQSSSTTDEFYLRILDRWDAIITEVGPITMSAADTWQELTISQIQLPDPLPAGKVIFRVQVYHADGDSQPSGFLIRSPFFAFGFGPATIGVQANMLLDDAQVDHAPGLVRIPYISRGAWTDTLDESGGAWTREEHIILRRGKHYGSQIIGSQWAELGYEYDVEPGAGAGAGETEPDAANWYLRLWNEGGRGTTHSDIAFHVGYGVSGGMVAGRTPQASRWLAEGANGIITEVIDTAQEAQSGVYEEFFSDGDIIDTTTLQAKAQHQLDQDIANRMAITVELDDSAPEPYADFDVGDKAPFSYFGTMDTNERRISEIGLAAEMGQGGELFWTPTITASKLFTGEAAKNEAIYRLLREYKLLKKDRRGAGDINAQAFPFPLIAASDAPTWIKQGARWVCDGVSDVVTIDDALSEMQQAGGFGIVYLSSGSFNIDMTSFATGSPGIDVPATLKLQGAGRDATIINLVDASTSGLTAPFLRLSQLAEIRDVYISTYGTGGGPGPVAVQMAGDWSAIRRCGVDTFDNQAVEITGADFAVIEDSEINGPQDDAIDAIQILELSNYVWIRNNDISNGRNHIRVTGSQFTPSELTISGNRFSTSNLTGIYIEQAAATSAGGLSFKITDNHFDNQGFNAVAPPAESAIYIEGVAGEPIDDTAEEKGYGNIIARNQFEATFSHGIRLHNVTGATIADNYLEDVAGHGIWLSGDTDHSTVKGNRLFYCATTDGGNTWDAIHVDGNENLIHDNTTRDEEGVANKARYALAIDGNDNIVHDNDLRATGQTGTYVDNGTGNQADIWQDYTVAWTAVTTNPTIGDGAIAGRFVHKAGTVHATIELDIGSTTTLGSGAWEFSLPATPAATADQAIGTVHIEDSGTGWDSGTAFYNATDAVVNIIPGGGGPTLADSTTPIAWANGDRLTIEVTYETQ